jgi:heat shock protein HslJ
MRTILLALATVVSLAPPGVVAHQQGSATAPATAQRSADQPMLEGPYWRLKTLGETTPTFTANAREPHLIFYPGGSVAGADGCNTLKGSYRADGEALTIGPLMGTLMACPGLDRLDRRFLDALGATKKWKASTNGLTLLDGKDQTVATFEARLP